VVAEEAWKICTWKDGLIFGGILPVMERVKYGKSESLLPFCLPSAVVKENRCTVKVKSVTSFTYIVLQIKPYDHLESCLFIANNGCDGLIFCP
jgi:hypothetical protein